MWSDCTIIQLAFQHVYKVPARFPPYLYDMFVYTLCTWPLKSLPPQPEVRVESQMNPGYVDGVCVACNTDCDSSVSLCFLFPSMSLERWRTDGSANTILCIVCNVLQSHFIRFLPLRSNTYPSFHLLSLPESPLHLLPLFFLFPSPLQQIKKSKTTILVSAICPTWQQEALFPCMYSRSVKTRWVHKSACFECAGVRRRSCSPLFMDLWGKASVLSPDLSWLEATAGLSEVVGGGGFYPSACE